MSVGPLIDVVHGVNFDVLELRDPEHYGGVSLGQLEATIQSFATELGMAVRFFQSNSERELVEHLHSLARAAREAAPAGAASGVAPSRRGTPEGIVINAGAWTHYSWAIGDALALTGLPAVEVHLSDVEAREEWRRVSVVRDICLATYAGHGADGYRMALERLRSALRPEETA